MEFINLQASDAQVKIDKIFSTELFKTSLKYLSLTEDLQEKLSTQDITMSKFQVGFATFMIKRFGAEHGEDAPMAESYICEWAQRFIKRTAGGYADSESRTILKNIGIFEVLRGE